MTDQKTVRIAVDIGGTFTDVALELEKGTDHFITAKTPTTPQNPVQGAMTGVGMALERAGKSASAVGAFIHGTTLATNALLEKKGSKVGVITTAGFRDILEIAYERRYDQYDINLDKPDMLVPRECCLTIEERMRVDGSVMTPLNEGELDGILAEFERLGIEAVAICLLHSYVNPSHEQRIKALIAEKAPHLYVTLSSEVSPEAREFDRLCTAIANAYIHPLMENYLLSLDQRLKDTGFDCPLYIITSGGGMTTLETAMRFPIRLVESGPSGGAILAAQVAGICDLEDVVSFDVGGTTAKICLIHDRTPMTSRKFEIGRAARFMKGSGLPVRIPVIEMIEIGAGGGSIARLDPLGRITLGPDSAGSEPGPACFKRGGTHPTVTDSDLVLGAIDAASFAEGRLSPDPSLAEAAIQKSLGDKLGLDAAEAAFGIGQIVDENMASAGRVHAVEHGKDLGIHTMVAFGGNGPLHAAQVAEKMGVKRIVVPRDPGVGSAVGFLFAPVSFEIVRSLYTRMDQFALDDVNDLLDRMTDEATRIVEAGAFGAKMVQKRAAFMRYKGQGHEIEVPLPNRALNADDIAGLGQAYDEAYAAQFSRSVPGMIVEILNWSVTIATEMEGQDKSPEALSATGTPKGKAHQVYFGADKGWLDAPLYKRDDLRPGHHIPGPALIVEEQTTTRIGDHFDAHIDGFGNIILEHHSLNTSGEGA